MKNIILTDLHIKEIEDSFFRVKKEKMIQDCIHEIINNKELKRVFFNGDIFNESKVKTS
jgi:metallophosphoesterase superfamily enzyme